MRPDVDRPAELVDCVVDDGLAEMAVRLEREARNVARRGCAGAGAHRDWIRRVINVGDARVVASWREREMQPACGDLLAGRFEASAKKDREEIQDQLEKDSVVSDMRRGTNATAGTPKVTPSREARAPPSEWPTTQI